MKRLSVQDAAFLQAESVDCPMHIASVQIFDLPRKYHERRDFVPKLMKRFSDTGLTAPFNWKLHSDWSKLDVWPSWIEDENVDMDYHVRFVALPAPGDRAQLMRLVERLHVPLLDRDRPLWEIYFIDGLEGGRMAVYFKTHHALIDGVAGMSMIAKALSDKKSTSGPLRPIWSLPERRKHEETHSESLFKAWRHRAEEALTQISSLQQLTGKFVRRELKTLSTGHMPSLGLSEAPRTPFNVPISRHRHLEVFSIPLSRTKEIAKDYGATVNDVVLAISGSAIRNYLKDKGQLPEKPVLANCPVSVRPKDQEQQGNNISVFVGNLGTDMEDPVARLKAVSAHARKEKERISELSPTAAQNYATIFGLTAILPQLVGAGDIAMPPANVVISNVPGPRQPLYLGDAKLAAIYPVSVLMDYQGFNITVLSREDSLDFGLIASYEAVDDLKTVADYMQAAFDDLAVADDAMLDADAARVQARLAKRKKAARKKTTGAKPAAKKSATTTRKPPARKNTGTRPASGRKDQGKSGTST